MRVKLHSKDEDGNWVWYLGWTSERNLLTIKDVGSWFTILLGNTAMIQWDRYDSTLQFVVVTKRHRIEYGIVGLNDIARIRGYQWVTSTERVVS